MDSQKRPNSPTQQTKEMQDYLLSLMPTLTECLTQLSLKRPADPFAYLSSILLSHSYYPQAASVSSALQQHCQCTHDVSPPSATASSTAAAAVAAAITATKPTPSASTATPTTTTTTTTTAAAAAAPSHEESRSSVTLSSHRASTTSPIPSPPASHSPRNSSLSHMSIPAIVHAQHQAHSMHTHLGHAHELSHQHHETVDIKAAEAAPAEAGVQPTLTHQTSQSSLLTRRSSSEIRRIHPRSGPLKLIIAGGAGSGKGTQCDLIASQYNLVHISTGDVLREAVAAGEELGQIAKQYMDRGQLLPDDIMISIVKARLEQEDCQTRGFLLDGFPRTSGQAHALKDAHIDIDRMIVLNVPDATLIDRAIGRRMDPETGKIYHLRFNPPPPEIEGRLIQRTDDTEEAMIKRLRTFHASIHNIEHQFQDIIIQIDGNRDKSVVYSDIQKTIEEVLASTTD